MVLYTGRAERADKHWEDNSVLVIHMRDGKQAEIWGYLADQYAHDEFVA